LIQDLGAALRHDAVLARLHHPDVDLEPGLFSRARPRRDAGLALPERLGEAVPREVDGVRVPFDGGVGGCVRDLGNELLGWTDAMPDTLATMCATLSSHSFHFAS
jgi:hypothetical protein